jgi:eukaryotic-like serine/threonine-protein kinase
MTQTTTASDDASGRATLDGGRYEIRELLGAGAMGQVFAARDLLLDIDVAVKMMHPELAESAARVALFTSEAAVSARMQSPHVVKVLALITSHDGLPCIIYERLIGETLGERIARAGGLSLSDTVEVVKQTSRALARAHSKGVIHRDVKPDNIFLTTDTRGRMLVKLLDFGIAAMADRHGKYSGATPAGTPEYMAPEVLFGTHDVDARADLYALGIVAFECLTGQCPFPGDLYEVLEQLGAGISPAITRHRPDLAGAVDAWIERALHPEPYWRFASARELRESFELAASPAPAAVLQSARLEHCEAA